MPLIDDALTEAACRVEDLLAVLEDRTDPAAFPLAADVVQEVLVYDSAALLAADPRRACAELVRAFADGPGVVVLKGAYRDLGVVDRVTAVFEEIIAAERDGSQGADHFAPAGTNDRIWNALEKLALADPEAFVAYYANPVIALASTAWLGPGYQMTSQPNVVRPGGQAQVGHRDYHLGFLPSALVERFPAHVHRLSPVLTLQGAVAHSDMPVETGPTKYLPHSQKYLPGYLAVNRPDFRELFEARFVQLPLAKGDAAFFNPAVVHGAGTNRTPDVRRVANLLQVSSAFGRAMESVDRERVCAAIYPALRAYQDDHGGDTGPAVAAAAEGYAFPTNIDRDPPVDGLAPPTQADLVRRALAEGWSEPTFRERLAAHAARRRTS